jgi:hypothetical protein
MSSGTEFSSLPAATFRSQVLAVHRISRFPTRTAFQMTDDARKSQKSDAKAKQKDRLGEQLRANLQRRKAQTRARRTGAADQRPEGIAGSIAAGIDPEKPPSDR